MFCCRTKEKISLKTDKRVYAYGEDVELTGKVNPAVPGEMARLDVYDSRSQSFISNAKPVTSVKSFVARMKLMIKLNVK
jgi:hypothetical protein